MKKRLITTFMLLFLAAPASEAFANDAGAPVAALDASVATAEVEPAPEAPAPSEAEPADTAGADEAAPAAEVPSNQGEAIDMGVEIASRLKQSQWLPAFALFLLVVIYGLRRWVFKNVEWFQTKTGGFALAFGTSLAMTVSSMVAAGDGLNFGMLTVALGVAWKAAGMHGHVKDIKDHKVATS